MVEISRKNYYVLYLVIEECDKCLLGSQRYRAINFSTLVKNTFFVELNCCRRCVNLQLCAQINFKVLVFLNDHSP